MNASLVFKNISGFKRRMNDRGTIKIKNTMHKALDAGAEIIVGAAKERTPVDTGLLKANVTITPYDISMHGGKANIAYTQQYAPYVHERLELKHKVGEAKFLENAMKDTGVQYKVLNVIKGYLEF